MITKKASSTFVLRDPKAKKCLIFLVVRIQDQNKRIKFSTGESINPKHWDKREKRAKLSAANGDGFLRDELILINSRLDEFYRVFRRAYLELQHIKQEPTIEYFREELVKNFGGRFDGRVLYLVDFAERYIEKANVSDGTKRGYKVSVTTFKEYEEYTGRQISFDGFKMAHFDNFVNWMHSEKKFAKNTVGARIKNLKVFFNKAYDYGHHTNEIYRKFKVIQEESPQVSLSEEELDKLWSKDLSENSRLEKIRDIFFVGCRTALRFDDWGRITPEMIDFKARKIRITTGKTIHYVVIPLHWQVEEILNKYDGRLPKVISNQKFNKAIKELCKLVELNEIIIQTKTIGGKPVTEQYKKHELISSHTARRTAATLWYKAGHDSLDIRKITGHKDEKSFLKYIKISEEESADRMLSSDYYKSPMRVAK